MTYWFLWLIIILFLAFVEAITVDLVCLWFIISGILALIVSFFSNSFQIQFLVFSGFGIILLVIIRGFLLNKKNEFGIQTHLIGKIGIVTTTIKPKCWGEVKVGTRCYRARAEQKIPQGVQVRVLRAKANRIFVQRTPKLKKKKRSK